MKKTPKITIAAIAANEQKKARTVILMCVLAVLFLLIELATTPVRNKSAVLAVTSEEIVRRERLVAHNRVVADMPVEVVKCDCKKFAYKAACATCTDSVGIAEGWDYAVASGYYEFVAAGCPMRVYWRYE